MIFFRWAYHSQTIPGFFMNPLMLASSSGFSFDQIPSVPRKVGTPLSAETPAPVNATIARASLNLRASPGETTGIIGPLPG